jgi:hypothetical protein
MLMGWPKPMQHLLFLLQLDEGFIYATEIG